jgi:transcriptional regulator with XRE-family HTH domain
VSDKSERFSADYLLGLDFKETSYANTLGGRLKELLRRSPKTQERVTHRVLGEYLGVTNQCVSSWAHNKTAPSAIYIAPIAEYFGVTCDYLLRGTEEKE